VGDKILLTIVDRPAVLHQYSHHMCTIDSLFVVVNHSEYAA